MDENALLAALNAFTGQHPGALAWARWLTLWAGPLASAR